MPKILCFSLRRLLGRGWSTRTSVKGLVCVEIDCKVSFKPCSKVRIEERGFSCKVSNSPRIALCLFEITGGGA
jgi:hypothetical protein